MPTTTEPSRQVLLLRKKAAYIAAAKDRPCADCGNQLPPREMHFDHVRGEKLFVLAEGAVKSWAAIKAEIAKCEIRCRPCHEARHRVERWRAQLASYGLTLDDFDRMLVEQAGRCAACSDPLVEVNVDHDHGTGEVRGLLCRSCNAAAGMAGDDPARLRQIAAYLEAA